ncbi:hypothetical protein GGR56DRAFT_121666 [Xylariaceae sp. FL0804]|nr:hypothetical protein GGR56DRAFT_121666 [Xylariaceae sp. FL0804]
MMGPFWSGRRAAPPPPEPRDDDDDGNERVVDGQARSTLLQLPADVLVMLLQYLPPPAKMALALTSRAAFDFLYAEARAGLRASDWPRLLPLLEREETARSSHLSYCHFCNVLHRFDPERYNTSSPSSSSSSSSSSSVLSLSVASSLFSCYYYYSSAPPPPSPSPPPEIRPWCKDRQHFAPNAGGLAVAYQHAHLVMNRHLWGEPAGLPLHTFARQREVGPPAKKPWWSWFWPSSSSSSWTPVQGGWGLFNRSSAAARMTYYSAARQQVVAAQPAARWAQTWAARVFGDGDGDPQLLLRCEHALVGQQDHRDARAFRDCTYDVCHHVGVHYGAQLQIRFPKVAYYDPALYESGGGAGGGVCSWALYESGGGAGGGGAGAGAGGIGGASSSSSSSMSKQQQQPQTVYGSCDVCLTDYETTITRQARGGPEGTGAATANGGGIWSLTITSYHQLGSCRSPYDPKWQAFAVERSRWRAPKRDEAAHPDGAVRQRWESQATPLEDDDFSALLAS